MIIVAPFLLWTTFLFTTLTEAADKKCYHPDGTSNDYTPCSGGADTNGDVACCNLPSDTCLQNGLCLWEKNGAFYRNGCTNRDWNTFACAQKFLNLPPSCTDSGAGSRSEQIYYCSESDDFCCGDVGNRTCCSRTSGHFAMSGAYPVRLNTRSETTASATASPTDSSARTTTTVTASCEATATASSCGSKMATGAGIGVGATAGVAAVLAIGAALLLRERRRTRKRDLANQPVAGTGPMQDYYGIESPKEPQWVPGSDVGELSTNTPKSPVTAELGGTQVK